MDLTDKVAIVTGSGRGIGKAIALRLAQAGATVVTNSSSDSTSAEAVAAEIKAMGRNTIAVRADVSISEDVIKMVDAAVAAFGKVDILVNNAGITRDRL